MYNISYIWDIDAPSLHHCIVLAFPGKDLQSEGCVLIFKTIGVE